MLAFAFATSITPGPNNTLVMMTAANWGFRASLPVFFGVVSGFLLMVFAVGLGLGEVFAAWPLAHTILKWACFAWLLFLAWKIAQAGRPNLDPKRETGGAASSKARPLSFGQLVFFQWMNPKAWMMAVGSIALFVPVGSSGSFGSDSVWPILRLLFAFTVAGAPCVFAWGLFGLWIARFLTNPRRVRVFNVSMAILLVLSMIPTLF
jgi:threonine/homoserine/homoserine lactone efflux protein